jgi:biopolymer transport protein ExbD
LIGLEDFMRRRRARPEEDTSIDMTPMLDIVFIMLIFFIVTATFVKESGIDVTRPDAETSVKQSRVGILIAINDNNEVWINRRQVELAAVRANVERLHAENPQGGAVIQADKRAQTGILVDIMDQVRLAGVNSISIAAEEK